MDKTNELIKEIVEVPLKKRLFLDPKDQDVPRYFRFNDHRYFRCYIPSSANFEGRIDSDGEELNKIPKEWKAYFFVPASSLYNDPDITRQHYFQAKLPSDYSCNLYIDKGATDELLDNGKHKHHYATIKDLSLEDIKNLVGENNFVFTVSNAQLSKVYKVANGSEKLRIMLPLQHENELIKEGCYIVTTPCSISKFPDSDKYKRVTINRKAKFRVQQIQQDKQTGGYLPSKFICDLSAEDICNIFKPKQATSKEEITEQDTIETKKKKKGKGMSL